jgi:hypothetical protein
MTMMQEKIDENANASQIVNNLAADGLIEIDSSGTVHATNKLTN